VAPQEVSGGAGIVVRTGGAGISVAGDVLVLVVSWMENVVGGPVRR
jgi:hypothetical protein